MRLYVKNKNNPKEKIFLRYKAGTRFELKNIIRSNRFRLKGMSYTVDEVMAESGSDSTMTGAILGGVIGLVGGPLGIAIGATTGGVLGNKSDHKDEALVKRFNNSRSKWLNEKR